MCWRYLLDPLGGGGREGEREREREREKEREKKRERGGGREGGKERIPEGERGCNYYGRFSCGASVFCAG